MTDAQLLRDSIAHWVCMRDDPQCGEEPNYTDCPLCSVFFGGPSTPERDCRGCPIREFTGMACCDGTPYDRAASLFFLLFSYPTEAARREWRQAADAEIAFLSMLLKRLTLRMRIPAVFIVGW